MKLCIYGRNIEDKDLPTHIGLIEYLQAQDIPFILEHKYYLQLRPHYSLTEPVTFSSGAEMRRHMPDYLLSLGGDGTLLETLAYVKDTQIPVMGVNLGRLGFLSSVQKENLYGAVNDLRNGHYRIERRSVIEINSEEKYFFPDNYALNDFTIHKRDTGSMISIDTYLNGEYFNTYWADGIIVSTPTGSTAYSLSCGGPIIFPDSRSFVITAVAPHNLNIRPIIVSDSTVITFRVTGRGSHNLISLDSRFEVIEQIKEVAVQKASFFFNLVKLNRQNFIDTLREKLKWGLDSRNL